MTAWQWPGTMITRVIDGDTVDALVTRDMGFGGTATFIVRLRLNRINAPALHSAAGKAARQFLVGLLVGPTFDVTTVKPYKYGGPDNGRGEFMAEIMLPDGRHLSDVMVAAGHAVSWNGEGPRPNDGLASG